MKILVIDDNPMHQASARFQFADHDLTVVGTYDEANLLVGGRAPYSGEFYNLRKHDFDVVLCDLLMPASEQQLGPEPASEFSGQEMPVGIFLALLAARNGAKYVAVFTDSNHHAHPISACFDNFNPRGEGKPEPFEVGGAKFLLANNRDWVNNFDPTNFNSPLSYEELMTRKEAGAEVVKAKNWRELMAYLIG